MNYNEKSSIGSKMTSWFQIAGLVLAVVINLTSGRPTLNQTGYYENFVVKVDSQVKNLNFIEDFERVMKEFALELRIQTNSVVCLSEINVILPPEAEIKNAKNIAKYTEESDVGVPCIILEPPNNLNGNTFHTTHLGHCGDEGHRIHITSEFFQNGNVAAAAKVLVHEWAHYRWGIFDEYGTPGSTIAPSFYITQDKTIKVNGCPSNQVGWLLSHTHSTYEKCHLDKNGLPDINCRFVIFGNKTHPVVSTMMNLYNVQERQFCGHRGDIKHSSEAPNAQNQRCQGQSSWDVMEKHSDFASMVKCKSKGSLNINVKYWQKEKGTRPEMVFIFRETTAESTLEGKLYQALKWILHCANLTGISAKTLEIPGNTTFSSYVKDLMDNKMTIGKHSKIFVSPDAVSMDDIQGRKENSFDWGLVPPVNFIGFPASNELLMQIMSSTKGKSIEVPQNSSLLDVVDALAAKTLYKFLEEEELPILVYRKKFLKKNVADSFSLESSCGEALFIVIHEPFNKSPLEVVLGNDNLNCSSNMNSTFGCHQMERSESFSVFKIHFEKPRAKLWRFEISVKGASHTTDALWANVLCQQINRKNQTIKITPSIFSHGENSNNNSRRNILLSVEVAQGPYPVLNANVSAHITNESGYTYVHYLYDDGVGPDITEYDGIYSNTFINHGGDGKFSFQFQVFTDDSSKVLISRGKVHFNHTEYSIFDPFTGEKTTPIYVLDEEEREKVFAEFGPPKSEFLLSDLEELTKGSDHGRNEVLQNIEKVKRFTQNSELKVKGETDEDTICPGQVTDLKVTNISYVLSTVTLQWTTPGDDDYYGQATSFLLKYFENTTFYPHAFHSNSGTEVKEEHLRAGTSLKPLEVRKKHTVVVGLPNKEGVFPENLVYFFALVVSDEAGNNGPLSNIATAFFKPEKYSVELQNLKRNSMNGMMVLYIFLFFVGCIAVFIVSVKIFKRFRDQIDRQRIQ